MTVRMTFSVIKFYRSASRLPALSKKYMIFESPDVSPENVSHLEKSPK